MNFISVDGDETPTESVAHLYDHVPVARLLALVAKDGCTSAAGASITQFQMRSSFGSEFPRVIYSDDAPRLEHPERSRNPSWLRSLAAIENG